MSKRDIYQEITDKIITILDSVDLDDYQSPFADLAAQGMPFNPVTDHSYNGINIPNLWCDQQEKGFTSN
ncbi:antirestriction protein ArdC [Labrenzia sp. EL_195]|nr:antirestriction protein ArdC [Labrenzia sp. EL_195]